MKKNILIWISVIIGVILTALIFISNIAGAIFNSGVCYYGCPNSKRVDKLILEKKNRGKVNE